MNPNGLLLPDSDSPSLDDAAWLVREMCPDWHPSEWNGYYLPHYFERFAPADFHADFDATIRHLHRDRGQKHSRIAPRGGAKSTWWTLAYPLRAALEGWEPYTLILSDSSSQADQHLDNIKKELEDNELIRAVYRLESGVGPEWNQSRIRLRNGALIEALGTGKKVRGRRNRAERPSLIVFDDIQSNEDVASPVLRERAWEWATREVIPAGDERTNFLAVGSALHREAVSVRLGQLAGWSGRTHRAVHHWPDRMDLWGEFERRATNLADDDREATARAFYATNRAEMDAGAEVYWPARFPIVELMLRRAAIGSDAFESEYNGVPGSLAGAEWPSELFDRPGFFFDDWPADIVLKVQSLDPSKGTTDKSDYQAHVLLGLGRFGDLYCECELHREPRWVERAIDLAERWKPAELWAEGNNCMNLLLPAAQQVLQERREQKRPLSLTIRETIVTVPKVARIRTLNDYLKAGRLHVRNTAGGRMLVEQLRDFPAADYDDGPDALATALAALSRMVNP
jgi:predicted phage terminase large subunit-like protein